MDYRIAVMDLDGTLTNSQKRITEPTKKALSSYMDQGGVVVLASGRPTYGIVPLANELELDKRGGYILSFNGGQIIECQENKIIYQKKLSGEVPGRLARLARKYQVGLLTYEGDKIVTEEPENKYVRKEALINSMQVKKINDFASYVNFSVTKCMMVADGDYLERMEPLVREELGAEYSVFRSEPFFLEIVPEGIDKARSLQRLLDYLGEDRRSMAAFGDGFNDRSMLKYAGFGVAMGNAQQVVKAEADYTAPSNEEDGVAWVLEHIIMGRM